MMNFEQMCAEQKRNDQNRWSTNLRSDEVQDLAMFPVTNDLIISLITKYVENIFDSEIYSICSNSVYMEADGNKYLYELFNAIFPILIENFGTDGTQDLVGSFIQSYDYP